LPQLPGSARRTITAFGTTTGIGRVKFMALWIIFAVMTAAAMLAVFLPMRRPVARGVGASADKAVYRDQFAELERDVADGRIGGRDADAARAEIARRLIAAERGDPADGSEGDGGARPGYAGLIAALAVPLFALSLYIYAGTPGLPGQPLQARAPSAGDTDIASLISRVESHLADEPDDGRGWAIVAPVYMRLGRPADAATAWRNAIRIDGATASAQAGLGEALVASENGVVTVEAEAAFNAALALQPGAALPRFYLALARQQGGDADAAIAGWQALLADAPADAPWRVIVTDALARAGSSWAGESADAVSKGPGPDSDDIAAAAEMSATDRQAMIAGMVDRLAERLASEPDDIDGWLRLMRAYSVMGRETAATDAAHDAMKAIAGDAGQRRIASLAAELGLKLNEAVTR